MHVLNMATKSVLKILAKKPFATLSILHEKVSKRWFTHKNNSDSTLSAVFSRQRKKAKYFSYGLSQANPMDEYVDRNRGDIDLCSCDYLGLAQNEYLNKVEAEAVMKYGRIYNSRSAAYPCHSQSPVREFEERAADWLKASETLLVNSGTEANVDVLQLLLAEKDLPVYIDKYAHYTFVFGTHAAGRHDFLHFKHNDVDDLLALIRTHGPGVVCIDTVYSTLGNMAPIEKIVDICEAEGCVLIADEAHALGTTGSHGEGVVSSLGLQDHVAFRTASLTKAFGAGGGLIAFNHQVAEGKKLMPIITTMQTFSAAPQDSLAWRLLATLTCIQEDQWRRQELQQKTEAFRKGCLEIGYQGAHIKTGHTNIVPFEVGPIKFAKGVYDMFVGQHIYPSPHFYPGSPRNKSVIRFTICTTNTNGQIQHTLDVMRDMYLDAKPWTWYDAKQDA